MNIFKISLPICAAACVLVLAGCASERAATPTAPTTVKTPASASTNTVKPAGNGKPRPTATLMNARDMKPDTKNYRVRGLVKGVEKSIGDGRMTLIVSHENIPGFMPAMEMRVPFKNNDDAKKVKAGDKIAFDMNRTDLETSNFQVLPPATQLKIK